MKNNRRKIKTKEGKKKVMRGGEQNQKAENPRSSFGKREEKSQKNVLVFRITILSLLIIYYLK